MPRVVPANFKPRQKDIDWAMAEFNISRKEVDRQIVLFCDHEYPRSYTHWNRALRNWFRRGDEYKKLRREPVYRQPEELSQEQHDADAKKAWAHMNGLRTAK